MTDTATAARPIVYVVPCGAAKLDRPAPARELYTGDHFRNTLAVAERMAEADNGVVVILSARYGLVELDTVLEPYDVTMTDADAITVEELTATAVDLGAADVDPEVYALLPGAYFTKLAQALEPLYVYPLDVYEASPGIGYQRGTVASIRRSYAA